LEGKVSIQFLGACGEVTGSCYYLEEAGVKFLVDCGVFQGSHEAFEKNRSGWPFNPADLDFVLLTHAHYDHCGRLPKLYKDGFRGHIYTTPQTAELANLVLSDAADIMFHDAKKYQETPLYTLNDVKALNSLYRSVQYKTSTRLGNAISTTFYDAGHILGSAIVEVKIDDKKIVFSGDLGNYPVPLMNPPTKLEEADVLVMESTYGDRMHEHVDRQAALRDVIIKIVKNKGTLLIPAFALERTQEILYHLNDLREKNEIPDVPIYLDSPMAIEATAIFRRNEQLFDTETQAHIKAGDDVFNFPHLKYCTTIEESKSINFAAPPKVIIAGSGMLNGGRILHHLAHYGHLKNTVICFVGYQVAGTLGRKIMDGEHSIQLFHEPFELMAEGVTISAFSAHMDKSQLLDWVKNYQKLGKIIITHGEDESRDSLVTEIKKIKPNSNIVEPKFMQTESL
jgi:metallo-beta-lactamase family protein